jgi:hypothetical protein
MSLTHHACAQVDCDEEATHVVIESQPLAMLFKSGGGLVCARHAETFMDIGGVPCSVEGFLRAARDEWRGA